MEMCKSVRIVCSVGKHRSVRHVVEVPYALSLLTYYMIEVVLCFDTGVATRVDACVRQSTTNTTIQHKILIADLSYAPEFVTYAFAPHSVTDKAGNCCKLLHRTPHCTTELPGNELLLFVDQQIFHGVRLSEKMCLSYSISYCAYEPVKL